MKQKPMSQFTFDELVDWAAGFILLELIKGNFRQAVFTVLEAACRWRDKKP